MSVIQHISESTCLTTPIFKITSPKYRRRYARSYLKESSLEISVSFPLQY